LPTADFDDFESYVKAQEPKPRTPRKVTKRDQAIRVMAPKDGEPPTPPDGVPATSVLAHSAPSVALLHLKPSKLYAKADGLTAPEEVDKLERRVGLLARYIIEALLWDEEGWSKKERYDAAVKAISTLEGTKERLWVRDEQQKVPYSEEELVKERKEVEERLRGLLRLKGARKAEVAEVATEMVQLVKGGEA